MRDIHDISELRRVFAQECLSKFSFLTSYGFEQTDFREEWYVTEVVYKNQSTGVKISFEPGENRIFLYLIRLINGEIPAYIDTPSRWLYLDNIVRLRSPSTTLPRKGFGEQLSPEDIDHVLTAYAAALREYGEDVLSGEFSVFTDLKRQMDQSRSTDNIEDIQIISSVEELVEQQRILPAQIVEYYDTYFSELRSQLQNLDLSPQAKPDWLQGFKRVISIGGRNGLVVAHFPIDLGITLSETETGKVLLRFPSLSSVKEDFYEFLQFPDSSVSDLMKFISGEEDVGLDNLPEEGMWGVATFNAPQLKADSATREVTWQSPWTRLVTADLYHLRYWEVTERALLEAREDANRDYIEFYTSALRSGIEAPTFEDADYVATTTEDTRQNEVGSGDLNTGGEIPEDSETYQRGEFGQIFIPDRAQVDNLSFSVSRQAA